MSLFVAAAVLTPSADPWNQVIFAAPMIGLYVISISIAWLVSPKSEKDASSNHSGTVVPLVFVAAAINHTRKETASERRR